MDETIPFVDEEFVDKRPKVLMQHSAKNGKLRIFSKTRVSIDNRGLHPVDNSDWSKGFERLDSDSLANFLAYSMTTVEMHDSYNFELSAKFIEGRDAKLYGNKVDQEFDPKFFAWNSEYKLKPQQAAMVYRIMTQLTTSKMANDVTGGDFGLGQGFFNTSEPATGKTPTSIATTMAMGAKKVIVVALTSLLDQWASELEKFHAPGFCPPVLVINSGAAAEDRKAALQEFAQVRYGWCIIGYATFRDHIADILDSVVDYDFLICDESGVMRNEKNQVAVAAQRLIFHNTQPNFPDYNNVTRKVHYVMHLNGTPVPNHGGELWNLLRQCRASDAVMTEKDEFHDRHADVQEIFIPERNLRKTVKSGIKNLFSLSSSYAKQYGGLPSDKSALPKAVHINVDCVMSPEEEAAYRALEQGYSLEIGKTSLEAYRSSQEKQNLSQALDVHRSKGAEGGLGLTQYLDLLNDAVTKPLGLSNTSTNLDSEDDGIDGEAPPDVDISSMEEQIAILITEWHGVQNLIDPIIARRNEIKTQIGDLRAVVSGLAHISGSDNEKSEVEAGIEKLQAEFGALAEQGKAYRAQQAEIRERQHAIEENLRQAKVAERLREQTRASTLIRLRRAAAGGEWVVKENGTKELFVYPSAKFRWVKEFCLENPLAKKIVFVSLKSTAFFLSKELAKEGISCGVLTGDSSKGATETLRNYRSMDKNDQNRTNILIMTCDKGVGLNLQMTRHVIFESKPYLSTLVDQNIARAVREFGTESVVNIYHLYTKFEAGQETCDHYVQAILDKKARTGAIFGASNPTPLTLSFTNETFEEIQARQRAKIQRN